MFHNRAPTIQEMITRDQQTQVVVHSHGQQTGVCHRTVGKRRFWDGTKYVVHEVVKIMGRYYPANMAGLSEGNKIAHVESAAAIF